MPLVELVFRSMTRTSFAILDELASDVRSDKSTRTDDKFLRIHLLGCVGRVAEDALGLQELVEAELAPLAPVAALLVAAERRVQVEARR